ncbi:hypothetical protein E4T42_03925 [Aureobasidium subglaciale]|nr:hypothetical protein E4T42_03925 [Aureobasidium subglaciale]
MKYTLQSLALASVASARVLQSRQSSCCFGINVSGDGVQGGSLGQLSDGQNRFGPNQSGATYCIDNGQITDKNGRGCILTGPTTQFQCDQGASPTGGFSVAASGQVVFNGDATFYACPVDDNGNYNIYTKPLDNMPKCVKVGLSSVDGKCAAPSSAPASSAPPATTAVSVSVSTPAPSVSVSVLVSTEQCRPSTIEKTVTQQNDVTVPVTVYKTQVQTQTQEHTDTAYQTEVKQVPTTIYQIQTQYSTVHETVTVPTTVYKTQEETTTVYKTEELTTTAVRTEEETQTQTQTLPPVTEEITQKTTIEQPTTIEQSTTVQQPPVTQTKVTSVTEQVTTSVAQPTTVSQPPATVPKASSSQQPSTTPSGTGNCPRNLPGMDSYLKPRLIIPVDSNSPSTAYGTQYNAYIGNGNSTIFTFDIPQSYSGKQCELVFTLPTQSQLETSFVSESGHGGVDFKQLKSAVDEKVTFANQPAIAKDFGEKGVQTGNAYSITTGDCSALGQAVSYELTATGDKEIDFFQDWNPCPIGLWIVAN